MQIVVKDKSEELLGQVYQGKVVWSKDCEHLIDGDADSDFPENSMVYCMVCGKYWFGLKDYFKQEFDEDYNDAW